MRWKDTGIKVTTGSLKRIKLRFCLISSLECLVSSGGVQLALKREGNDVQLIFFLFKFYTTHLCLFLTPLYSTHCVKLSAFEAPVFPGWCLCGATPLVCEGLKHMPEFHTHKTAKYKNVPSQNHLSVSALWVYATFSVSLWHLTSLSNPYFTRYDLISAPRLFLQP